MGRIRTTVLNDTRHAAPLVEPALDDPPSAPAGDPTPDPDAPAPRRTTKQQRSTT